MNAKAIIGIAAVVVILGVILFLQVRSRKNR